MNTFHDIEYKYSDNESEYDYKEENLISLADVCMADEQFRPHSWKWLWAMSKDRYTGLKFVRNILSDKFLKPKRKEEYTGLDYLETLFFRVGEQSQENFTGLENLKTILSQELFYPSIHVLAETLEISVKHHPICEIIAGFLEEKEDEEEIEKRIEMLSDLAKDYNDYNNYNDPDIDYNLVNNHYDDDDDDDGRYGRFAYHRR